MQLLSNSNKITDRSIARYTGTSLAITIKVRITGQAGSRFSPEVFFGSSHKRRGGGIVFADKWKPISAHICNQNGSEHQRRTVRERREISSQAMRRLPEKYTRKRGNGVEKGVERRKAAMRASRSEFASSKPRGLPYIKVLFDSPFPFYANPQLWTTPAYSRTLLFSRRSSSLVSLVAIRIASNRKPRLSLLRILNVILPDWPFTIQR